MVRPESSNEYCCSWVIGAAFTHMSLPVGDTET